MIRRYKTGSEGRALNIVVGKGKVGVSLTGPEGGHYPGKFMTPDQADRIALGFLRASKAAREKAAKTVTA